MATAKDYYKILGVGEKDSAAEIKKVYRRLARKYHPDTNAGNKAAEEKFKEVSEAYYVLGDEKRRKEYDQMRQFGGGSPFSGAQGFNFNDFMGSYASGARGSTGRRQGYSVFDDIFSDIFGGGQQSYHSHHHQAPQNKSQKPQEKADLYVNLRIGQEVAEKGGKLTFSAPNGKKITVTIPEKTEVGKKMRLARQGNLCSCCGHPGDLILTIAGIK